MTIPKFTIGDTVLMRKKHPCGSNTWVIYRVGADVGLSCTGCTRRVMMPRKTFLKYFKQVLSSNGQRKEELS